DVGEPETEADEIIDREAAAIEGLAAAVTNDVEADKMPSEVEIDTELAAPAPAVESSSDTDASGTDRERRRTRAGWTTARGARPVLGLEHTEAELDGVVG